MKLFVTYLSLFKLAEHEEAQVAADAVLPVVLCLGHLRRPRRRIPGQPGNYQLIITIINTIIILLIC